MSQERKRKGPYTKRQVLQMIGGSAAVGLAGCSGGGGDSGDDGSSSDGSGDDGSSDGSDTSDNPSEISQGGTLEIGVDTSLQTLDPRSYGGLVSIQVFGNLYSQLMQWRQVEDGYVLEGDLATDWEWQEETELVIELDENAEFWNGDPVTSEHVLYTIQSLREDPSLSVGGDFRLDLMSEEAIDDHTVLIDCDEPIGSLEASLGYTLGIVNKDIDQQRDIRFDPMGSGPFVLEERTGDQVILEANEDYWKEDEDGNQLPYLDGLVFNLYSERGPRVNALEQGELDHVGTIPILDVERLQEMDEVNITMGEPGGRRGIIHFNTTEPPFDDVHARRAILHAMDWETIVEGVWRGFAEKAGTQATPTALGWDHGAEDPYDGVDIEAAEAEIEASPYSKDEFQFTNLLRNTDTEVNRAQQAIQDTISSELGIDYDFEQLDDESWRTQNRNADGFGFTVMDWSGGWDPDHFTTMAWSEAYFNWGGYANDDVDELYREASLSRDKDEREEMYRELHETVHDDAGKYFAYWYPHIQGHRSNVYNVESGMDLMMYFERVWKDD